MPDPLLFVKAVVVSIIASVACVLVVTHWFVRRQSSKLSPENSNRVQIVSLLAITAGLVAGYAVSALALRWPPASGLDRLLEALIPAMLLGELITTIARLPRWSAWLMRIGFAALTPRILLHGSVYLEGGEWSATQAILIMALAIVLLMAVLILLTELEGRSQGTCVPLSLAMAILTGGLAIMLAGYIKGGTAAFPLAATIAATSIAVHVLARQSNSVRRDGQTAMIVIGVVGLFGLLFIGVFFGRLTIPRATAILIAPLLCWTSEIQMFRSRKKRTINTVRIVLVAIPLVLVLWSAKRDFDRDIAPLLGKLEIARSIMTLPGSLAPVGVGALTSTASV